MLAPWKSNAVFENLGAFAGWSQEPMKLDVNMSKRPSGFLQDGKALVAISFLIPVYNAARFLAKTLDSIIQQNDGLIEIICVNDGSTDSSDKILSDYQSRCPFIRVVSQNNQGITSARNRALSLARGIWVCFVDDDDIVADNAVKIFEEESDLDIDILYADYERFTADVPDQSHNLLRDDEYFVGRDIEKLQSDCINRFKNNVPLISHKVLPTPWAKLYNREFLKKHGLTFDASVKHEEDIVFNFNVLSYCTKVKKLRYVAYYYRWTIGSESHRYRPGLVNDVARTLEAYRDIVHVRYKGRSDIELLYRYRVLWELMYCVVLGPIHPGNPAIYGQRREQFRSLRDDCPIFRHVFSGISTMRFEYKQSLLATLIKLRWFWCLDKLGRYVGKAR